MNQEVGTMTNCKDIKMSELHEAPEEIFLQVDPEGDAPGGWDTLDGATWCESRINHNDVRYVRADLVKQLEAENRRLREALEAPNAAVTYTKG